MGSKSRTILVEHTVFSVVIHALSLYTLYLYINFVFLTSVARDYRVLVHSPILWSLMAAIAFNYAFNLWSLSITMHKLSLCIGLVMISVALYKASSIPVFITMLTGGSLSLISFVVALVTGYVIVSKRVLTLVGKVVAVFSAVAIATLVLTTLFTLYKPQIPVFYGREAVLPTGEVVEVDKVLRAYLEKGDRKIVVTDYGGIPVKTVAYHGREVEIDTYRGIINILREEFEFLRKIGEQLVKSGLDVNIITLNLEVSKIEYSLARLYPYVKPLITAFPRVLLYVLKLIYGLLVLIVVVTGK